MRCSSGTAARNLSFTAADLVGHRLGEHLDARIPADSAAAGDSRDLRRIVDLGHPVHQRIVDSIPVGGVQRNDCVEDHHRLGCGATLHLIASSVSAEILEQQKRVTCRRVVLPAEAARRSEAADLGTDACVEVDLALVQPIRHSDLAVSRRRARELGDHRLRRVRRGPVVGEVDANENAQHADALADGRRREIGHLDAVENAVGLQCRSEPICREFARMRRILGRCHSPLPLK